MEDQLNHGALWNLHRHLWSRDVEVGQPTRVEEAVPQTRQPTPSGAAAAQTTPDVPTPSSSAFVSSSGGHAEGDIPMSEIKRPRGRPITRVLPMPDTVAYTITTDTAIVELPIEQPVPLTWEVREVPFQFQQHVSRWSSKLISCGRWEFQSNSNCDSRGRNTVESSSSGSCE